MEAIVDKYIELRDAKGKLKAAYDAKVAKLDSVMDRIEGVILEQFNAQGIQSCSTKSGTAYKQVRTSASVADWDATFGFIQSHELWNMLERRVSKNAVIEYKDAHDGIIPPGLNWREESVINVRRS